jgi:hypothetical protein
MLNLYPRDMLLKTIIINIILIYHKVRPGCAIEGITVNSHKTINIINTSLLDVLKTLKLKYKTRYNQFERSETQINELKQKFGSNIKLFTPKPTFSIFISSKTLPKTSYTDKQWGRFLGYICSSNDFREQKYINEGRYSFSVIEKSSKQEILTEVCMKNQDLVKTIKYYQDFIQKGNKVLLKFNIQLKVKIQNELTQKIIYL